MRAGFSRRDFLKVVGLGAGALSLPGCLDNSKPIRRHSPARPNFIVIFTDDQGYQDVGCFGSPSIDTPNLDRMADEGAKFTDFYVAASICSPSRAALLTGCYPPRVSLTRVLFPRDNVGLNPDEITIADVLKTQGYATACVGKWHLGHLPAFLPTRHGFDSYFGLPYSNDMWPRQARKYPALPLIEGESPIELNPDQRLLTKRYTEESIKFIRRNRRRPFFLYLAHTMPHVPLYASNNFQGRSKRGLYGDVIMEIDWSVGEILKTLQSLGLDERTLVVFTSDNGPWLSKNDRGGSALPLRDGKFSTYEGGMRVPCIMRWPGKIEAGDVCSEVASTIDLLPTFAALAGADVPGDRIIDGKDISALMTRPSAKTPHEAFFYYRGEGLEAVRSDDWKLVFERKKKKETVPATLYNLKDDISEQHDVSAEHPDVVARLSKLADKMRHDIGDSAKQMKGKNIRPIGRI
jgi:arylsulfatase A-like enzyme